MPVLVVLLLFAAVPVAVSLRSALVAPGQASVSVRLVDWVRAHGGGPVVDLVENLRYAMNAPRGSAPEPGSIPAAAGGQVQPGHGVTAGPPRLPSDPASPTAGEGIWHAAAGQPSAVDTAYFRPLPESPSVVVGAAWVDQSRARTQLIAGTRDPYPSPEEKSVDGRGAKVPAADRSSLLATFNSGFRMQDANGGYYVRGRSIAPLRDGAASLAIDESGHVEVGMWGRELRLSPLTSAVRQNLDLIVDRGVPVDGLDRGNHHLWGSSSSQFQYTWRSGLGVDRHHNLIYVAADRITLADLARCLAAAGAERGMQLDIHPQLVTFMTYGPRQALDSGVGTKLLPAMVPPADRYLVVAQRDFLAVTARASS